MTSICAARQRLGLEVHPLFQTRGPPGTHDVALGLAVLDHLKAGQPCALPRFDKARDEPLPVEQWVKIEQPVDLILFEGWCVGASPQSAQALVEPINALERQEDGDATWRRAVNGALAGPYQTLFSRIDRLVQLVPPSFDIVHTWRCEQEHELIASTNPAHNRATMSDDAISRFIQHYERLTRHCAEEMPQRADLVLHLDAQRQCIKADCSCLRLKS